MIIIYKNDIFSTDIGLRNLFPYTIDIMIDLYTVTLAFPPMVGLTIPPPPPYSLKLKAHFTAISFLKTVVMHFL